MPQKKATLKNLSDLTKINMKCGKFNNVIEQNIFTCAVSMTSAPCLSRTHIHPHIHTHIYLH